MSKGRMSSTSELSPLLSLGISPLTRHRLSQHLLRTDCVPGAVLDAGTQKQERPARQMLRHGTDAAVGVTGKQHLFIPPSQGQGTRKAQKQMLDMMGIVPSRAVGQLWVED